jgi:hypothetical protein
MDWTVTSSAEWLTVERAGAQVKATAAASNGFAARTAVVTIAGDDLTAEFEVSQDTPFELKDAELLADGKTFEAIEKQNEYQANKETQLRETIKQELLSSNPTPPPVNNTGTITKEQFGSMGYMERVKLANENPELYNQLNS